MSRALDPVWGAVRQIIETCQTEEKHFVKSSLELDYLPTLEMLELSKLCFEHS